MRESRYDLQIAPGASLATCMDTSRSGGPRLVVVLQEQGLEVVWLARQIWEFARVRGLGILLVGVAPDATGEADMRRQLITLAAFIWQEQALVGRATGHGIAGSPPEIQTTSGKDWLRGIRRQLSPADTLACFAGQVVGVRSRPLSDVLGSSLNVPIYVFEDLQSPGSQPEPPLSQVAAWAFSLAAIVGFLFLQAKVVIHVQGWAQSLLLLLTLVVEIAVIWLFNSLIGSY